VCEIWKLVLISDFTICNKILRKCNLRRVENFYNYYIVSTERVELTLKSPN